MPVFPPDDVDMWNRIEGKQGDSAGGRCSEPVCISALGEMQGQVYQTQLPSLINLRNACVFYVCLLEDMQGQNGAIMGVSNVWLIQ